MESHAWTYGSRYAQRTICPCSIYYTFPAEQRIAMERKYLAVLIAALTLLSLALVGAMAFGTVGAQSSDDPTTEQSTDSTIDVSATGEASAPPDEGVVQVAVVVEGNDTDAVSNELAADADELRDALDELDVDYETTSYGVTAPHFAREEPDHEYEGHHSFEVTTEDPDVVGDVVDAAAGVGAQINDVELTLSEEMRDELQEEAIEDAIAEADTQAETIADASSLTISHASDIDASQRSFSPVAYDAELEMAEVDDDVATEIESDDVSISYSIDVTYNATSG